MTLPTTISLNPHPVIDLEHRHFAKVHGNVMVIGTWYMDPETHRSQPCLALIDNTRHLGRHRVVPCIIPMDQAWRWTVEIGDPKHVWATIGRWIEEGVLPGSTQSARDLYAIFDAVQEHLTEMLMMPPMPAAPAAKYGTPPETVGELLITNSAGAVLHEVEVKANVRD